MRFLGLLLSAAGLLSILLGIRIGVDGLAVATNTVWAIWIAVIIFILFGLCFLVYGGLLLIYGNKIYTTG